ncbi:MAG TPA: FHA domain-containing protein [Candidatus Polarisedimenticolia bacterium]|nr:FHA domain-containing protein [Candidatus Polarisedimenticolia bacterium]
MSQARNAAAADTTETVDQRNREVPFGAPHVFVLVVVDGDDAAGAYRIVRTETILGRGEGAHITIEDEKVSKSHCRIRVEGPVVTITDLGSRNGTTVNDRRMPPNVAQRLKNLDEIEVGSHRLLLLAGRFRATPSTPQK